MIAVDQLDAFIRSPRANRVLTVFSGSFFKAHIGMDASKIYCWHTYLYIGVTEKCQCVVVHVSVCGSSCLPTS